MDDLSTDDMSLIQSLSADKMGLPPVAAPEAVTNPPAAPNKDSKETPQEAATAALSPKTENTTAKQDPFEFFEVDGNAYTPEQIKGMVSRYKGMNYEHQTKVAPIKKSVEILNQLRQTAQTEGLEIDDDGLAAILENALTAYSKNPVVNKGTTPPQTTGRQDFDVNTQTGNGEGKTIEEQMAEWERDNAITLPPAYKQAVLQSGNLANQVQQLTEMVKNITKVGADTAATAEDKLKQATAANADAGKQQIMNNMARIQNEYKFPDESEQDFMAFVQARGYDLWELMDYNMAKTLAEDFKNNQASPELERIRQIHQKRQAFTGNLAPAPGGNSPATPPAADADQQFIDQVANDHMKNRNML